MTTPDKATLHRCDMKDAYPEAGYGAAVTTCMEYKDGTLWVDNLEYGTQVNYCPACGFKARKQVTT